MALLDLSLVTKTLVNVVRESILASPKKPPGVLNVTSLPPDRLAGENTVGLYMYHLVEEAAHKNAVWPGRPLQPIRFSPMGLNLHYVLSARSELAEELGPYREQLLMGLAVKALHDYPIIDDFTEVAGAIVMEAPGDENKLRLALRHVPAAEAISYWTAGSHPLRLSSYYEVSVVLLEPDEPDAAGGRVLTYGIETFIGSMPRLSTSRSALTFQIPTEAIARTIEVQPAQAAAGEEITLLGSGLGGGPISVLLRASGWRDAVEVDAGWGVSGTSDRVFMTVQNHAGAEWIFPGTYTASVAINRSTTAADGTVTVTRFVSNETPLQIAPKVAASTVPAPSGEFSVTGGLFAHPTDPLQSPFVRASIGRHALVQRLVGPLARGEFRVVSPTQVDMRLPGDAVPGQYLPFRITINGSESSPHWVQVS